MKIQSISLIIVFILLMLFNGGLDNVVVNSVNSLLLVNILIVRKTLWSQWKQNTKLLIVTFAFFIWSATSIIWSINSAETIKQSLQWVMGLFIFLLASSLNSKQEKRINNGIMFIAIASVIYSLFIYVKTGCIDGTLSNANPYSILLLMVFLVSWGEERNGATMDWLKTIVSAIILVPLFVFSCRAVILIGILGLAIIILKTPRQQRKNRLFELLIITAVVIVITKLAITLRYNIAKSVVEVIINEDSVSGTLVARGLFWKQAIKMAVSKPLTGYGLGSFALVDTLFPHEGIPTMRFAHNYYLQTFGELGIVGLGLLVTILGLTAIEGYKKLKRKHTTFNAGYIAGWVACIIHSGFDYTFNIPACMGLFFYIMARITTKQQM